jgi:hypothetical protein
MTIGQLNSNVMRFGIIMLLVAFFNKDLSAQKKDTWFSFYNADSSLIGYKDKQGKVKIEARFSGFTTAAKFDDILSVVEEINGSWLSYYLLKSERKFGADSLYIRDNMPDCENEGFIRFKDLKTDKAGIFNKQGEVIIPADYNDIQPVRNGLIVALKNAQKEYWDKEEHSGCNHFSWKGGEIILLDTLNNILINDFTEPYTLNLFSIQKSNQINADSTRRSFLSSTGEYLSFIDFEKEFRYWLSNELFKNFTQDKLSNYLMDTVIDGSGGEWLYYSKAAMVTKKFDQLKKTLLQINEPESEYFITSDGLNPFLYEGAAYDKYFNNCGESKDWIYPVMQVVISYPTKKNLPQDHFEFLRTDKGYKLISVSIRNH